MYSSESLPSREGQSVLSPTPSDPNQQFSNAPAAVQISRRDVSQRTSSNDGIFTAFEAPPLSEAPGSASTLSSEPSDFNYGPVTKVALGEEATPLILGPLETPYLFSSDIIRPKERRQAKIGLVSRLVSQMICSFPERRMNEDSCPPFIHHSTFQRSVNTIGLEDPMIICQEITHKFAARKAHGDFFVWDAIASEQERLYDHRNSFDKWLYLSSAQAVTIYLLMLAAEGESILIHRPNLPIALLFTLGSNFEQLNQIHPGFEAARERSGDRPAWEDWIFAESKLRTAMVYFIFALHFNVEFGLPCDREIDYTFEDVDLPAAKILWEAKNELSWRKEFELIKQARDDSTPVRTSEARLKYGDLVRLNSQHGSSGYSGIQKDESRLADRLDEWKKEMDDFGILVALCSTMV
jgi:hypothetical protein